MMNHFNYTSFFEPAFPFNYDNLLDQEILRSILGTKHRLFDWKKTRGQEVINEGEKLIKMINLELQKLNTTL